MLWHRKAKDLFWQTLYFCGGFELLHCLYGSAKVLMYHRFDHKSTFRKISKQTFESQLRMLLKRFRVISLAEYTAIIRSGRLPDPDTLVLTFDDGYQDFYYYAFPILQKYGLPATLFVTTGFIDGDFWMWPDMIEYIVLHSPKSLIHLPLNGVYFRFKLDDYFSRISAWNTIADYCLTVSNPEKFQIIDSVAKVCDVRIPMAPSPEYQALNWNQLRYMAQHDIEVGSHTVTHPILSRVEKAEDLVYEIQQSKKTISEQLDCDVTSFAYPNGKTGDYTVITKQVIKNAGYRCAVVSYPNSLNPNTNDMFELGRSAVGEDDVCFKKKLYNVELPFIRYLPSIHSTLWCKKNQKSLIEPENIRIQSQAQFSFRMISPKHKANQRKI
ncbi:MAG: polysaccharide deacetylase family protein [Chitinispirillaceae bacterium]